MGACGSKPASGEPLTVKVQSAPAEKKAQQPAAKPAISAKGQQIFLRVERVAKDLSADSSGTGDVPMAQFERILVQGVFGNLWGDSAKQADKLPSETPVASALQDAMPYVPDTWLSRKVVSEAMYVEFLARCYDEENFAKVEGWIWEELGGDDGLAVARAKFDAPKSGDETVTTQPGSGNEAKPEEPQAEEAKPEEPKAEEAKPEGPAAVEVAAAEEKPAEEAAPAEKEEEKPAEAEAKPAEA